MTTPEKTKAQSFSFTTSVRGAYADIIKPRAFQENGKPKGEPRFGCTFLVAPDSPDLARLKAEVTKVFQAAMPGLKLVPRRLTQEEVDAGNVAEVQVPWHDGTRYADKLKAKGKDGEIFRGCILVKSSSKFRPALALIENKGVLDLNTEEVIAAKAGLFYSGAWYVPSFGINYYKGKKEGEPNGVNLFLDGILYVKGDTRLGGRQADAKTTFAGYIGSIKDENPLGGEMDDEIPF